MVGLFRDMCAYTRTRVQVEPHVAVLPYITVRRIPEPHAPTPEIVCRASHIAHQLRMGGAPPDFFWQEDVVPWVEIYPGFIRDILGHIFGTYTRLVGVLNDVGFRSGRNLPRFYALLCV